MKKNLAKTYDPKDFEDRIYETWEESGAFNAEVDPDKKPFTIVMPPPVGERVAIAGKVWINIEIDYKKKL